MRARRKKERYKWDKQLGLIRVKSQDKNSKLANLLAKEYQKQIRIEEREVDKTCRAKHTGASTKGVEP